MKIIFLIFIILLVFLFITEGFEVNDYKYEACSNKILSNNGLKHMLTNYNIVRNDIRPLPEGTVSAIINASGVRNEHRLYAPPLCMSGKAFVDDYFINNNITNVNNPRNLFYLPILFGGLYGVHKINL